MPNDVKNVSEETKQVSEEAKLRPLGRFGARELTREELEMLGGAGGGTSKSTQPAGGGWDTSADYTWD